MKKSDEKSRKLRLTPIISADSLEALYKIEPGSNWQGVIFYWLILAVNQMFSQGLCDYEKYFESFTLSQRPSSIPDKEWSIFLSIFKEIKTNIKEALSEKERTFLSERDVIETMIKEKRIPNDIVKALLGGKWPEHQFNFDAVSHFKIIGHKLVPYDGDEEAPGPNIKISLELTDDPTNDVPF